MRLYLPTNRVTLSGGNVVVEVHDEATNHPRSIIVKASTVREYTEPPPRPLWVKDGKCVMSDGLAYFRNTENTAWIPYDLSDDSGYVVLREYARHTAKRGG